MKTLTLLVVLCSALAARALPTLNVSFTQNNWYFDLNFATSDGSVGWFQINGVNLIESFGGHFTGDLDPMPKQLRIGENIPSIELPNGQEIFGASFIITAPVGDPPVIIRPDPPAGVPDSGSTVALLLVACAGMWMHGRAVFKAS